MIGNVLKLIRIANENAPVKAIASKLDMSQGHISDIENDHRQPSFKTLLKFSEVYISSVQLVIKTSFSFFSHNLSYYLTAEANGKNKFYKRHPKKLVLYGFDNGYYLKP